MYRFILHAKKTGFVVEHDFIMATYLADRVIVFSGTPSLDTVAHSPQSLLNGMNRFLELLGITFRRDPNNFRPRINKNQSVKVIQALLKHAIRCISLTYILFILLFRTWIRKELDSISFWKNKCAQKDFFWGNYNSCRCKRGIAAK